MEPAQERGKNTGQEKRSASGAPAAGDLSAGSLPARPAGVESGPEEQGAGDKGGEQAEKAPVPVRARERRMGMYRGLPYDIDEYREKLLREAGITNRGKLTPADYRKLNPPGPDNAYNYAPDRTIAPGWQKRLLIALAFAVPAVGALFYGEKLRSENNPGRAGSAATRPHTPDDLDRVDSTGRMVLHGKEEALALAKEGRIAGGARCTVDQFSGTVSYEFSLKIRTVTGSGGRGGAATHYKKIYLGGIEAGEEQANFDNALGRLGIRVGI